MGGDAFGSHTVIAPPAQGRNGGGSIGRMENETFIEVRALLWSMQCTEAKPCATARRINRVLAYLCLLSALIVSIRGAWFLARRAAYVCRCA
jgi:hypothetical protein